MLTSKNNPTIKQISSLQEKKFRKTQGLFLVEGFKMVHECFNSGLKIRNVVVSENYKQDSYVDNPIVVSESVFSTLSDVKTPQGILSVVEIPILPLTKPKGKCLLLDGISDPGNLGTIIRTANAAGYEEIYLAECTDAFSPKCVRASMSGLFFVKIYTGTKQEILSVLQDVPIIMADMNGENIFSFTPPDIFVLAIGNEANGISKEVEEQAKYTVKIPMRDTAESLNAAVSAGICIYALINNKEL